MKTIQIFTLFMIMCVGLVAPATVFSSDKNVDKQALIHLVKNDCGSCHGLLLNGGLGPSLLKKDLQHKSDKYLFNIIKFGRMKRAMPSWKEQLSDQEIGWIIKYLKSNNE